MKKLLFSFALLAVLVTPLAATACGCQGNQYRTATGPVTPEEAEQITTNYLATIDDKLQMGDIQLDGQNYLVDVKDQEGNLIAKLGIDILTGSVRPIF